MFLARFASGTSTAGNLMGLEAIAAVVIGGAALSGGKGKVFGAVMGTVIFAVIANLLSLLNVSTFLQDAFRGALILVAVTLATVSFPAVGPRRPRPASDPRSTSREMLMTTRTRRRTVLGTAAAAAVALMLPACGQIYPSSEPAQGPANGVKSSVDQVVVGFAQSRLQAPYFAAMQVQSQEIADEQGFKLLFQAADKDPVIQMNQMQAMISQGADVLIVNATSVKVEKEMMTQIASQIPVTYIDTSVPGTGMTSVQSDNLTIEASPAS